MSTIADTKTSETEIMISIDSMHKWFDDFHVLKNINLEVKRGEKVVICGPSGSENLLLYVALTDLKNTRREVLWLTVQN